jgi:PelA/Pel-15E family pectate lyase
MAARARQPGESYFSESAEWQWIGTFDNDATTTQLYVLGHVNAAQPDERYRRAFERGLDYVFTAQFPNGCWPQVYPLQGGYHDNATYNDDNMAELGTLLRAVSRGDYPFVGAARRGQAATALRSLVGCVLASQFVAKGQRTVWGQQHDPLTLQPTSARSYELASLTGQESAHLVDMLMDEPSPDARVVEAVHAAAAWLRQHAVRGYSYRNQVLAADSSAGPLWARMVEIGTDRPMFFNRDGVRHYDWNDLTDRRTGYNWFTTEPVATLKRYDAWARAHPNPSQQERRP